MERDLYQELIIWKEGKSRLPLIVRGARQVGKTYLIEQFGKREFVHLHIVNFEKQPQLASCFQSLDPRDIVRELELHLGFRIEPGHSLLFFDEIQDCPEALKSMRYFAEEMPDLHLIAAGSLLEFVLEQKEFSFPVGRVQFMNLGPLTFCEFLKALNLNLLADLIQTVADPKEISEAIHQKLLQLVNQFFVIGGMPGVVSTFLKTESYLEVKRRQASIVDLYALDFGKYATKYAQHRHLKKLFERIPDLVGKHFKFSKIDPESANPARDYRETLERLRQARLVLQVHLTKGNGLPLRAEKSEKKFKAFFIDVGLLVLRLGVEDQILDKENYSAIFRGIISEQYVAQELCAQQDPYIDRGLYYWENSSRSSSAEIDFLVNLNQQRIPIEVKSGLSGRLKSLKQFMEKKNVNLGIQVSEQPLKFEKGILSVPFYLVGELGRLIKRVQCNLAHKSL